MAGMAKTATAIGFLPKKSFLSLDAWWNLIHDRSRPPAAIQFQTKSKGMPKLTATEENCTIGLKVMWM